MFQLTGLGGPSGHNFGYSSKIEQISAFPGQIRVSIGAAMFRDISSIISACFQLRMSAPSETYQYAFVKAWNRDPRMVYRVYKKFITDDSNHSEL